MNWSSHYFVKKRGASGAEVSETSLSYHALEIAKKGQEQIWKAVKKVAEKVRV